MLQYNTCGVALGNNGLLPVAVAVPAVSADGIPGVTAVGPVPGVSAVEEATGGILQQ